jgi:hypothetical protein
VKRAVALAALLLGLSGCPDWQRPACEQPSAFACRSDQPHYCSPSREWTPIGDEPCSAQGRVCTIDAESGEAFCDAPADGGAR